MGLVEWVIWTLVLLVPAWKVAVNAGKNGLIALVVIVPGIGLIIYLFIMAYSNWPILGQEEGSE